MKLVIRDCQGNDVTTKKGDEAAKLSGEGYTYSEAWEIEFDMNIENYSFVDVSGTDEFSRCVSFNCTTGKYEQTGHASITADTATIDGWTRSVPEADDNVSAMGSFPEIKAIPGTKDMFRFIFITWNRCNGANDFGAGAGGGELPITNK
jgi:hypothetical protein